MKQNIKRGRYERVYSQLEELIKKSDNLIAHKATISAVLYHKFDYYFWCGFYEIIEGELTVGPYQGPVACQILAKNKGVCWAAIHNKETLVVKDVEQFPEHIACDSRSKSEIVVPLFDKNDIVYAVLDIDSIDIEKFDEIDVEYLEKICSMLKRPN